MIYGNIVWGNVILVDIFINFVIYSLVFGGVGRLLLKMYI